MRAILNYTKIRNETELPQSPDGIDWNSLAKVESPREKTRKYRGGGGI